jgi:O-antigen ligase
LEFWRRSLVSIAEAPWIGHGTGAIQQQFGKTSVGGTGLSAIVTRNPHNQTLATALQLGALGAVLLWMMWLSHLWFFRGGDWLSLLGSVVVIQGIVGCLFNSHLADFTQGSLYVMGVGIIGGMLRRREFAEAKTAVVDPSPFVPTATRQ